MRRSWIVFALLSGCAAPAPESAPLVPEDLDHLQERVRTALESPFVLSRFYAEYEVDSKVKVSCKGTSRGFRSGVVLIEEESPAGPPRRGLRVGDRAWIYEGGWKDASEAGLKDLGAGFQNPYEVLAVLETAAGKGLFYNRGGMVCEMKDPGFMSPLFARPGAETPEEVQIDGTMKSGFREGPLVTRFSVSNGTKLFWLAKVDIVSWGSAPPMQFDDIPAPFTPDMKAAVRKATEGK